MPICLCQKALNRCFAGISSKSFNSISDSETPDETSYNIANVLEILEYAHSLCPIRHTSDVWNQRKPMWLLLGK